MNPTTPRDPTAGARTLADLDPPTALLFDLDGTLVDTVQRRIDAWAEAFRREGLIVDRIRLGAYIGSDGRWLARELAREEGRELDYAQTEELDRVSGAIFDELNSTPIPLPGATELLTALEESHLVFAIATSSRPGQVAASVDALCLPVPPPITDGSHVANAKPEPDLLLASAAQLGIRPERCWYVGDSKWDMMASLRAKMVAIGVTSGAVDAEGLISAGAAVAVASLTELLVELQRRRLVG
jgi:beta-phosphoglucomutase-like phosphatase (HAD superfamily)